MGLALGFGLGPAGPGPSLASLGPTQAMLGASAGSAQAQATGMNPGDWPWALRLTLDPPELSMLRELLTPGMVLPRKTWFF